MQRGSQQTDTAETPLIWFHYSLYSFWIYESSLNAKFCLYEVFEEKRWKSCPVYFTLSCGQIEIAMWVRKLTQYVCKFKRKLFTIGLNSLTHFRLVLLRLCIFFNPLKSRETQANLTKIMKPLKRQSIVVSNWEKIYIVTERALKSYLIPLGATNTGVFGKWNPSGGWNVGW